MTDYNQFLIIIYLFILIENNRPCLSQFNLFFSISFLFLTRNCMHIKDRISRIMVTQFYFYHMLTI